jgi:hypothetical protein
MEEGYCYDNAFTALFDLRGRLAQLDNMVLCHGYPKLLRADGDTPAGTTYGHAWLEGELLGIPMCVNFAPDYVVPRGTYYQHGRIDPELVLRYTKVEAAEQALEHNHTGPWVPDEEMPPGTSFRT